MRVVKMGIAIDGAGMAYIFSVWAIAGTFREGLIETLIFEPLFLVWDFSFWLFDLGPDTFCAVFLNLEEDLIRRE